MSDEEPPPDQSTRRAVEDHRHHRGYVGCEFGFGTIQRRNLAQPCCLVPVPFPELIMKSTPDVNPVPVDAAQEPDRCQPLPWSPGFPDLELFPLTKRGVPGSVQRPIDVTDLYCECGHADPGLQLASKPRRSVPTQER